MTMNRRFASALAGFIIVILVAGPQAQQAPAFGKPAAVTARDGAMLAAPTSVHLLVGRSTILDIGASIARVSLTVPDVADAMVTAPTQLLIHGKQPGTISMFVWDRMGAITTYEVVVRRDLTALAEQVKQLFAGEAITVTGSGTDVVLSGTVSSKYVIDKAADVAAGYVEKKENVVNLLKQQEGVASNQVMLRVRFAEVSRQAVQELGASWFTGPGGFHDYVARVSTQQFAAPALEGTRDSLQGIDKWGGGRDTVTATGGKATFSDFLNIFLFNNKYNLGTVIRAMQDKGLFQSLAEPNLIATNGKEASFLAGGEFPIPVVQSGQSGNAISIIFKEFGVRLSFTPTVLGGDLINLKVKPEVSALDFANAIVLDGFRIPALTTRKTETEVELRDGQTFAIAGLLNNTVTDTMRKIPGIGDIPILGWLFKSKAMSKAQTELVVMITPSIIRRGQMGVSEGLPSPVEPFMDAPSKRLPPPDPYVGSPRYPANQPAPGTPAPPAAATPVSQPVQDPVPSTPIQSPAALPAAAQNGPTEPEAPPTAAAAPATAPEPAMTEKERKFIKAEKERQEKAARAEAKRQAEADRAAAKKAEEDRKKAEKIEKARAKKQAEIDRKAAEEAAKAARLKAEDDRKKAAEEEKRLKAVAEAAARLKEAQEAYKAEIAKTNKGGGK
jgi:pilus assembly protein CpaC